MRKYSIAILLSGCGNKDGAEIHESTLTLLAIHKLGADYQCYAPDIDQHHVLNYITDETMDESRNVLVESARIARGDIKSLTEFSASDHDALIIPGGLGAIKNLSDYGEDTKNFTINEEVAGAIRAIHRARKPIGALCIAPVLLGKLIAGVSLTIGQDQQTISTLLGMGAKHKQTSHGEIVIDIDNLVVSTPCYMLDARVDQIAEGAENLVYAILKLIDQHA